MPINLSEVLGALTEYWSPRTVAVINDYDVRVVKVRGEFTRHSHPETDEFFLVLAGALTIRTADGDVELGVGDTHVVTRGVAHQPCSAGGAEVLLIEPSTTVNTGDSPGDMTAERRMA